MVFENPDALLLLPVLLIFGAGVGVRGWRKRRANALVFALDVPALRRQQVAKYVTLSVLISLGVIAAALPQVVSLSAAPPDKAVEIALLVDVSGSMAARPSSGAPSRLARVQVTLLQILDRLGEMGHPCISLHGFTDKARSLVPLVGQEDYGYVRKSIQILNIYATPGRGSMLGQPILDVVGKFSPGRMTKIIVLFSDGEPFIGGVPVLRDEESALMDQGVRKAQENGVTILTVGVGERQGESIPILTDRGEFTGTYAQLHGADYITRLQDTQLRITAKRTGGEYFDEGDTRQLLALLGDKLAGADSLSAPKPMMAHHSIALWFLGAALCVWVVFAKRYLLA